ncbi:hypothetical protein K437DRAFT_164037 [Tilletiaria anomala UBC 951]|uniref:Uncharacterized protein n=1 Tax=Tilletiaria anomala (strain ATCC 24038 / CBS 436.72 / UBC 951) TaxID=1037660 RepID=A0A066WP25_TILAU|nr:uncharacterized protein K437DRAFT_164037 [Tilletiaria anomala UBC 951]KDN52769.1 hypothetical protein K437DRAFT_164037 [Tilletiaria anomala UBC 951]
MSYMQVLPIHTAGLWPDQEQPEHEQQFPPELATGRTPASRDAGACAPTDANIAAVRSLSINTAQTIFTPLTSTFAAFQAEDASGESPARRRTAPKTAAAAAANALAHPPMSPSWHSPLWPAPGSASAAGRRASARVESLGWVIGGTESRHGSAARPTSARFTPANASKSEGFPLTPIELGVSATGPSTAWGTRAVHDEAENFVLFQVADGAPLEDEGDDDGDAEPKGAQGASIRSPPSQPQQQQEEEEDNDNDTEQTEFLVRHALSTEPARAGAHAKAKEHHMFVHIPSGYSAHTSTPVHCSSFPSPASAQVQHAAAIPLANESVPLAFLSPPVSFERVERAEATWMWTSCALVCALTLVALLITSDVIDWPGDGLGNV